MPSTKEPLGTKVFRDYQASIISFQDRIYFKSLFGALTYYNSISFALRKLPSVKSFQAGLTNQLRRMVRDGNPHWREAFNFSEPWIEYGGDLD